MINKLTLVRWHNRFAWFGGAAVFIWALSGSTHPLMAWLGPQATKFFPPPLSLKAEHINGMQQAVATNAIQEARVLKLVQSEQGPVLQLTENDQQPRRYFNLSSGGELPGFDRQQARWLAKYYTGREDSEIALVEFQTAFDADYPPVNRLIPVYKVSYTGEDPLTAYIYTETNALASLSNPTRARLQTIFQALHTWSWLDFSGHGRVLIMACLILSLLAMAATGLMLVISLKQRPIPVQSRRWHRYLAYALWLPLLGWSSSGFYHLLQAEYVEPVSGMRLGNNLDLSDYNINDVNHWADDYAEQSLNAVSMIRDQHGELFYRLSFAQQDNHRTVSSDERFDGRPSERTSVYVHADTGETNDLDDRQQAIHLAGSLTGIDADLVKEALMVTRFGANYDFRNKRLPAWRINYNDETGLTVFVDPVTGMLIDRNRRIDRLETLSFSLIHKWNHLTPFIGRAQRDILIVAVLALCIIMTSLGVMMLLKSRKMKKRARPSRLAETANVGVETGGA